MKSNYNKFILTLLTVTMSIASFAQDLPPDADGAGGGGNDPAAPIDAQIIWLAVIGIFMAYSVFSLRSKKA